MYGPVCLVLAHMVIGHVRHDRHIVSQMDKFVQRIETFCIESHINVDAACSEIRTSNTKST
jgi:hypothetical protein